MRVLKAFLVAGLLAMPLVVTSAQAQQPAASQPAQLPQVVRLDSVAPLPKTVTVHVGENVLLTTEQYGQKRKPVISVSLSPAGSMDELDWRAVMTRQLRFSLGDEEGIYKVYHATQTGAFTVSINYKVLGPNGTQIGTKTETLDIVVK